MTQSDMIFLAYLAAGFVGCLLFCRRVNGPLSLADIVVCAGGAVAWPILLAVLVIGSAFAKDSWFTRKRF